MKKIAFFLMSIVWFSGNMSCKMSEITGQEMENELCSLFNPSKNVKIDTELLIGEWDIIEFAYTKDGKKISNVATLSDGILSIPCTSIHVEHSGDDLWDDPYLWMLSCGNTSWYSCTLSGNFVDLKHKASTYMYITPPNEALDITLAFTNVCSFIIMDDKLILYFTGIEKELRGDNSHYYTEKIKNKNLLILKRK